MIIVATNWDEVYLSDPEILGRLREWVAQHHFVIST